MTTHRRVAQAITAEWGRVGVTATWILLHGTLLLLGRATSPEPGSPSLVWPAAGSALLWLMVQRTTAGAVVALLLMTTEVAVINTVTDAGPTLTLVAAVASLVQVVTAVLLLRRWCPRLLGFGGVTSVHDPETLWRGTGAAVIAAATGALIGGLALGPASPTDFATWALAWWARNLTGLVIVGACGHLLVERMATLRKVGFPRPTRSRVVEAVSLVVLSAAGYGLVFVAYQLPLAFVVLICAVWVGSRFTTVAAAWHTALFGAVAVASTLSGRGPFAEVGDVVTELLVTQTFLLTTMMITLAIASSRDQRGRLQSELEAERQEARERAELLDRMTDVLEEGIVIVDGHGVVTRANPAARTLLMASETGLQSRSDDYVIHRVDGSPLAGEDLPSRRALREGHVAAHDLVLPLADGSRRVLSVTATALTAGGGSAPFAAVVVYRDVTDERHEHSALLRFAETVAHDLRSPLTATRGWLDLARSAAEGGPGEVDVQAVAFALERASLATTRMGGLIADLLTQATAEGSELELAPVHLGGRHGLVLDVAGGLPGDVLVDASQDLPAVLADELLMEQLFANLLSNSIKYVAAGRRPQIEVTGVRSGDRVEVRVTDNGIGIPETEREKIFARLYRAHADQGTYSGTGLGLAICRTIVERHGGAIHAQPADDGREGSTFVFDLPAYQDAG